jgi:hypothetical protein
VAQELSFAFMTSETSGHQQGDVAGTVQDVFVLHRLGHSLVAAQSERLPSQIFEAMADRLGGLAVDVAGLVEEGCVALGAIEAWGDRIERLNSENWTVLRMLESAGS